MQFALLPSLVTASISSAVRSSLSSTAGQFVDLLFDRLCVGSRLLEQGGGDRFHGGLTEIPLAGELQERQVVALGDFAEPAQLFVGSLDPAGRAERTMVGPGQAGSRLEAAVENAAIIDDASDDFDVLFGCRVEAEAPRPRFERIEDDHGPVDVVTVFLETVDDVQGEAVCGPRGDAE